MDKKIWNGSDWVGVPMCENGARNTDVNYGHGIGVPQCYDEAAEFEAIVDYGYEKSPPMKLCPKCLSNLKKSARRHGYKLKSTRLEVKV
jgi:hypothetical protein